MSSASTSAEPVEPDGVRFRGTAAGKPDEATKSEKPSGDDQDTTGSFECNICLDTAKNAVVSMCGHLFCWPCLHQWLETREMRPSCPVCKSAISKSKVIPLYGRGADSSQDPRTKVPPRPQGRRTEAENQGWAPFGGGFANFFNPTDGTATPGMTTIGQGGFRLSVGIGAFPFGLFATWPFFHDSPAGSNGNESTAPANADAEWLSRLFLCVALFFLILLIIA